MTLIVVLYAALTFAASGLFVALLLPGYFQARPLPVRLALLYLLGSAALTIVLLIVGLLSLSFWWGYAWVLANLLLACGYAARTREALLTRGTTGPRVGRFDYRMLRYACAAVVAALLVQHWVQITMTGNIQWDAWAIWGLRARVMHVVDGLRADQFGSRFAYFRPGGSDYPIMVPLGQAWVYHHLASMNEEAVKYTLFFPLLAFCAVARDVFRRRFGSLIGWVAVGLILSMDNFGHYLKVGYMDPILGVYSGVSVLLLLEWLESAAPASLLLAGAFAGIAPWIKNDGAFTVLALAATVLAVWVCDKRPSWRVLAIFIVADIGFLIGWRVVVRTLDLKSWYGAFLNTDVSTYPTYVRLLAEESIRYFLKPYWLFVWVTTVVSIPLLLRRSHVALLYPLAHVCAVLVLFSAITNNMETLRYYKATNIERVIMQVQVPAVIAALYVFFAQCACDSVESEAQDADERSRASKGSPWFRL
jgi:hypothetical protein